VKLHALIHGPSDGLGAIAPWAAARGHAVTETRLDAGEPLPELSEFDLLVVMGGAMNVYQHRDHPWLVPEKRCLAKAIAQGKKVLGVCLGAQLIADVLGGKVWQNPEKEIGWWPVRMLARPGPFAQWPEQLTMFHWHGDTFSLPPGAVRVAESDACANQAFLYGDRVAGVQFHLEVTPDSVAGFIAGGESELTPARFVQGPQEALHPPAGFMASALSDLLEAFERLP
jgi:GMP synthase (glutamine-hydrolysing)